VIFNINTGGNMENIYGKVSKSPTITNKKTKKTSFDVADLFKGPVDTGIKSDTDGSNLDEKLRKAYFWITNYAIITPFYDIEFNEGSSKEYRIGDKKTVFRLPTDQSYSSFILLPLLNLAVKKRCLLIGGPGRGKTASAVLMGLMAGYPMKEIKRSIQHGQPQMTISDLLGNPIPSDLMNAKDMDNIKIPTRTQSALLTVMGDNYAEILDQIYECPESAWYLTANDDAGGGTYQVIEALRDRIDVVVRSLHFNTRFVGDLLTRIESGIKPEEMIPPEIIFTPEELDRAYREILSVEIPAALMRRIEFFASQFELFESGGEQLEYKTKDNVKLAGMDINELTSGETGKDRIKDIGDQTRNGFSVRTLMTCLVFIKAMAYFRGKSVAGYDDVVQVLPFVLHDKLVMNSESPFFELPENSIYRVDKISWIRKLFDLSNREFDRLGLEKNDPVGKLLSEFSKGLEGLPEKETRERIIIIERAIEEICKGRKIYGPLYDDILTLKYLHQRYTNYLKWLLWKQ
jgi:MoxR-like ATPase